MKFFTSIILIVTVALSQDVNENLESFTKIKIDLPAETQIVFGKKHNIQIDAPERILDDIEFFIRGNTLIVRSDRDRGFNFFNSGRSSSKVQIKITVNELEAAIFNSAGIAEIDRFTRDEFDLEVNGSCDVELAGHFKSFDVNIDGSGDIRAEDLKSEDIEISINGSGGLRLDGTARKLKARINGSGDIYAYGLEVDEARVNINGSGDVKITVNEKLKASIFGSGDLTYKGSPRVDEDTMGSGDVRKY